MEKQSNFHTPERQQRYGYEKDYCPTPDETKAYVSRVSNENYEREMKNTTVLELSKLAKNLKDEVDNGPSPTWKYLLIGGLIILFLSIILSSRNSLPYCGKNKFLGLSILCRPCPRDATCKRFSINCKNNKVPVRGICVKSKNQYKAALIIVHEIEKKSYMYHCRGKTEEFGSSTEDLLASFQKRLKKEDEGTKKLFNDGISLMIDNMRHFSVGEKGDVFFSYKFDSFMSCLVESPNLNETSGVKKKVVYVFKYVFRTPSKLFGCLKSIPKRVISYLKKLYVKFTSLFKRKQKKNDTKTSQKDSKPNTTTTTTKGEEKPKEEKPTTTTTTTTTDAAPKEEVSKPKEEKPATDDVTNTESKSDKVVDETPKETTTTTTTEEDKQTTEDKSDKVPEETTTTTTTEEDKTNEVPPTTTTTEESTKPSEETEKKTQPEVVDDKKTTEDTATTPTEEEVKPEKTKEEEEETPEVVKPEDDKTPEETKPATTEEVDTKEEETKKSTEEKSEDKTPKEEAETTTTTTTKEGKKEDEKPPKSEDKKEN